MNQCKRCDGEIADSQKKWYHIDGCEHFSERDCVESLRQRLAAAKLERDGLRSAVDMFQGQDVHRLRGLVNVLASKLAEYTGKTVPTEITGAESVVDENEKLRGLLREAIDHFQQFWDDPNTTWEQWVSMVQAALEGKP